MQITDPSAPDFSPAHYLSALGRRERYVDDRDVLLYDSCHLDNIEDFRSALAQFPPETRDQLAADPKVISHMTTLPSLSDEA
jgi:hypothetical protein